MAKHRLNESRQELPGPPSDAEIDAQLEQLRPLRKRREWPGQPVAGWRWPVVDPDQIGGRR